MTSFSAESAAAPVVPIPESAITDQKVANPFELWIDKMQGFWNLDVLSVFAGADDDDETGPIPAGFPTIFVYSGKANNKIGVRERPALDAARTGKVIEPGERFAVDRVLKIKGVQFAVLSSGEGYVSMVHPRTGVVLLTREIPEVVNQGEVGMMDIKGITKCCKDLSAEIVASQYWRESALVQLELLDDEAKGREEELQKCMSDLTESWTNVTEGNAPVKLMNHVGAIDASAESEIAKVQRLRHGVDLLLAENEDNLLHKDSTMVKLEDIQSIASDLEQLSINLNEFNENAKISQAKKTTKADKLDKVKKSAKTLNDENITTQYMTISEILLLLKSTQSKVNQLFLVEQRDKAVHSTAMEFFPKVNSSDNLKEDEESLTKEEEEKEKKEEKKEEEKNEDVPAEKEQAEKEQAESTPESSEENTNEEIKKEEITDEKKDMATTNSTTEVQEGQELINGTSLPSNSLENEAEGDFEDF